MKSVLISIKPKWCELIANGKKTIEVRKTRPKCAVPFKCYIYCTKDKGISFWTGKRYAYADDRSHNLFDVCGNGKAIGEFICNKIDRLAVCGYDNSDMKLRRVDDNLTAYNLDYDYLNKCRLSLGELKSYANGSELFGWHISDLVIYDKPKELSEFATFCDKNVNHCANCEHYLFDNDDLNGYRRWCGVYRRKPLTRPPQSWCYTEILN